MIVLFEAMLISVGTWIFFNWLPLYFKERYGMSLTMAGFSGTFIPQIATVAGVVLGGYLSDRIARGRSERRMLMMSACYMISAPLLFAFRMKSFGQRSKCVHLVLLFSARARDFERRTADLRFIGAAPTFHGIALCNTVNCAAAA